ncbi:MAG TPA: hypothetical protein VHC21_02600 [Candidatus Saccharimonadales bacterium]|nr:hypothetical protein [Candidatus Saccharimonadales bacterium]
MEQAISTPEPEPDAARRQSFLDRIRGRLPGLPRPRVFEAPAARPESEMLSRLEGRFAIVAVSLEDADEESLTAEIEPAVTSLVHNGYLDSKTVAETRPIIPQNAIRPGVMSATSSATDIFKDLAAAKGDVSVYRFDAPMTPTKRADSPVDPQKVWREVNMEHAYFDSQIHATPSSRDIGTMVVGMTTPTYAQRLFGNSIVFGADPLEEHQPLVLTRLGVQKRDLVLAPPFPRQLLA